MISAAELFLLYLLQIQRCVEVGYCTSVLIGKHIFYIIFLYITTKIEKRKKIYFNKSRNLSLWFLLHLHGF
jgi:hypothetical protein